MIANFPWVEILFASVGCLALVSLFYRGRQQELATLAYINNFRRKRLIFQNISISPEPFFVDERIYIVISIVLAYLWEDSSNLTGNVICVLALSRIAHLIWTRYFWSSPLLQCSALAVDVQAFCTTGRFHGTLTLPAVCATKRVTVELRYMVNFVERLRFWSRAIRTRTGRPASLAERILACVPQLPLQGTFEGNLESSGVVLIPFLLEPPTDIQQHAARGFYDLNFWSVFYVTVRDSEKVHRCRFEFYTTPASIIEEYASSGSAPNLPL